MNDQVELDDDSKYLLFRIGEGLYGTPLLEVREVIESQKIKPLPNSAAYFKGLINVRGQVIGVVDLRVRFGMPGDSDTSRAYLVFELGTGYLAVIVDRVEAVVKIEAASIQQEPAPRSHIPNEIVMGAATVDSQIVVLIDLKKTFSELKLAA